MKYKINSTNAIILADLTFMQEHYPNDFTKVIEEIVPEKEVNPTEFLIDKGSFFDRFGVTKLDVLKSTNVTIKAILLDISNRQWIDLKNPDVSGSLALIGTYVTSVTPELQYTILNSPVLPLENLALRKLYF